MIFEDTKALENYLLESYRLRNVIRYNTRNTITHESVTEHSYYVALFVLKICDEFKIAEDIKSKCIIKALLHDMPEIDLNDITHDVKEKLHLRPFLKTYEDQYFIEHHPEYADLMVNGGDLINTIVVLADSLSVYQYVLNETQLGNNTADIKEILEESKQRVKGLYEKFKLLISLKEEITND